MIPGMAPHLSDKAHSRKPGGVGGDISLLFRLHQEIDEGRATADYFPAGRTSVSTTSAYASVEIPRIMTLA